MCLSLYLASNNELPLISYNGNKPGLNTQDIADNELSLKHIFSKSFIKYIGSDQGCGCGFRHSILDQNEWFNVIDEDEVEQNNHNHVDLVNFIRNNVSDNSVEILTCWDGDHDEPILYKETLNLSDLLAEGFFFKERGFYSISV